MSQSCACSLFLAKTNEKDAYSRVPQSSSLLQSCAKEKSSGVEIGRPLDHMRHIPFINQLVHTLHCDQYILYLQNCSSYSFHVLFAMCLKTLYFCNLSMRYSRTSCFCLLYTSPSPRDQRGSRMPSSA